VHQPETVGDLPRLPIRRVGRPPEIIVGVVMGDGERVGERTAQSGHTRPRGAENMDAARLHCARSNLIPS
jgi:hypothetical protein